MNQPSCNGDEAAAVTFVTGKNALFASEALAYLETVNEAFGAEEPDKLIKFRDLMREFKTRKIHAGELGEEIKLLFRGHVDLIRGFNDFMPEGYKSIIDDEQEAKAFLSKVRSRLTVENQHIYEDFKEIMGQFTGDNASYIYGNVAAVFKDYKDLLEEFSEIFLLRSGETDDDQIDKLDPNPELEFAGEDDNMDDENYLAKSIQDIDLSACKPVSHSYWLLPENKQYPVASNRSPVLNDRLLCRCWPEKDFELREKEPEEEILHRCEDDRFELDMLLNSVKSAAKNIKKFLKAIDSDSQINLAKYVNILNLRCIERLYGDHGGDVIELLKKDPAGCLPVVLRQLRRKEVEFATWRLEFNRMWADVYAMNQDSGITEKEDSRIHGSREENAESEDPGDIGKRVKKTRSSFYNNHFWS